MIIEKELVNEYFYYCSACKYEWFSTQRLLAPRCPKCTDMLDVGFKKMEKAPEGYKLPSKDVCFDCSNNPKNGGSGFCNCTMALPPIY